MEATEEYLSPAFFFSIRIRSMGEVMICKTDRGIDRVERDGKWKEKKSVKMRWIIMKEVERRAIKVVLFNTEV
jgi:hypothetical protein